MGYHEKIAEIMPLLWQVDINYIST